MLGSLSSVLFPKLKQGVQHVPSPLAVQSVAHEQNPLAEFLTHPGCFPSSQVAAVAISVGVIVSDKGQQRSSAVADY